MAERKKHPYLTGNFAPIETCLPLTPCSYTGTIPKELAGGEYVRNGGNPITNSDLGRDAHWFDGDGMLSGVLFRRKPQTSLLNRTCDGAGEITPEFVNQYLLTDVYCYAKRSPYLTKPVLPSIATLVSPAVGVIGVVLAVLRTVVLAVLSRLMPGRPGIKKISVANTSVMYHDGRALATCESGPPLRFALPELKTIGWFNGRSATNEPSRTRNGGFGGDGAMSFMREWTTAHPKVDPVTGDLIAFHAMLAKPYVRYSIVRPSNPLDSKSPCSAPSSFFDRPIPGIDSPKMMHDFGVSRDYTVIMDLPLSLDPLNPLRGLPSLFYDSARRARFGVFPRFSPSQVRWFETDPCLIFHTANCWDTRESRPKGSGYFNHEIEVVNLLACRLTSASVVFQAGNLPTPACHPVPPECIEEEQCRLYYLSFPLPEDPDQPSHIREQWALSAIPFEFPSLPRDREMSPARYIYGCSTSESFTVALGKAAKIDYLAKFDVQTLIAQGKANPPCPVRGCVDARTLRQIASSKDPNDPIKLFEMPKGWYAQEPRFVPRRASSPDHAVAEDDGWLLFYVFDESQLDECGACMEDARSELWIIDARNMTDLVARIRLPQRVPYGLHGNWFSEEDIARQRPWDAVRELGNENKGSTVGSWLRDCVESWVG